MCLFPLLEVVGNCLHKSEQTLPSLVILGSTVVQNNTFILILSSRYVSRVFSLVECSPCVLMYRCPIVVLLDFLICLLMICLVRPSHLFRNPYLIVLVRLDVVGMNSDACKYCDSVCFDVLSIMLLITADGC